MPSEFDELMRQHASRIRRIAVRYASQGSVDDLVQEISVRLWRSYPSFRAEAKIETWIYRVALNAAMTHVKASIRQRAEGDHRGEIPTACRLPRGLRDGRRARKLFADAR